MYLAQLALIMVLIAVFAVATVPIIQQATAQWSDITMTTSADGFGRMFFGESVLQVTITDPDADNDGSVEDISVDIRAEPDTGSASSDSFTVPETSENSGRFEFFLTHVDADSVDPSDVDPINNEGVEGDGSCVEDCAPIITFGTAGDIDVSADLYEETDFEITVDNTIIEVHYEETKGTLSLDRENYPSTAFVYIFVKDQDANLNPTESDSFVVDPDEDPNQDLLVLEGATFLDEITFEETGDNTAVFEGRYRLGTTIDATSESVSLTLQEKANYDDTLGAPENDSNDTDEVSFTIGDTSGTISVGGQGRTWDAVLEADKESYSVGETVHLTITDQDANVDPDMIDFIRLELTQGSDNDAIIALETNENSGVFEASFSVANDNDVTMSYTDHRPADYSEKIADGKNPDQDFVLEIDVLPIVKTGVQSTTVTAPAATSVFANMFSVGAHIELSVNITNNNDYSQPFIALIEVRDSNDVTVFLALQSGSLQSDSSTKVGAAWQPETAGTYHLRSFTVSSLEGEVLSSVSSSQITVR